MTPYYADESVTLYHGDCRELDAWLTADVLVTDPPYGVSYEDWQGRSVTNDGDFTVSDEALRQWSGPLAVCANHSSLPATLAVVGQVQRLVRVATWHKTNALTGGTLGNPWLADVEFVVIGVDEMPKMHASAVMSARRNVGNPQLQKRRWDAFLHPTQKPAVLMEKVLAALPPGDVADPFAGSGSTLIAARALGRRSIGVEIEERYCEAIANRLAQGDLFGGAA